MENKELVINALRYYDKYREEQPKKFKNVKYYLYQVSQNDLEHSVVIFYDKDKKELFRSRYEMLGMFLPNVDIWIWAWGIPTLRKNQTGLIRKVLNYGIDLDAEQYYLKSELTSSRLKIENFAQLDIIVAIASYISKSKYILGIPYNEKDIQPLKNFSLEISDNTISCYYYSLLDI